MPRHFYAFEHTYGQQMADRRGQSIGEVFRFSTKAARDRWVSLGPNYFTAPRYREPVEARSREVRSATRADYWSVADGDAILAEHDALDADRDRLADQWLAENEARNPSANP